MSFLSEVALMTLGGLLGFVSLSWIIWRFAPIAKGFYHLAWWMYQRKYYKTALYLLEKAFQKDPSLPSITYTMGVIHLELNQLDRAKDYLYIATLQDPEDAQCLYHLGVLEYQEGRYTLAIRHWVNSLQYASEPDADLYYCLGLAYEALDAWQAASEMYEQGLQINPEHIDCLSANAYTYFQLGDLEKSAHYAEEALNSESPNAETYFVLSLLRIENGLWEEALDYAKEAVALEPDNIELLNLAGVLGMLHHAPSEEDSYDESLAYLEKASKGYGEGQEVVVYNYAIALGMVGENLLARRTLRTLNRLELPFEIRKFASQARLILQKQSTLAQIQSEN